MNVLPNNQFSASIPAQAAGTHIVYYIHATANNGKQQVRPIVAPEGYFQFKVLEQNTANISSINYDAGIHVYPNPASAITCIDITPFGSENIKVSIQNVLGQEALLLFEGIVNDQNKKIFFNAKDFAQGTYIISVLSQSGVLTTKVLIQ